MIPWPGSQTLIHVDQMCVHRCGRNKSVGKNGCERNTGVGGTRVWEEHGCVRNTG